MTRSLLALAALHGGVALTAVIACVARADTCHTQRPTGSPPQYGPNDRIWWCQAPLVCGREPPQCVPHCVAGQQPCGKQCIDATRVCCGGAGSCPAGTQCGPQHVEGEVTVQLGWDGTCPLPPAPSSAPPGRANVDRSLCTWVGPDDELGRKLHLKKRTCFISQEGDTRTQTLEAVPGTGAVGNGLPQPRNAGRGPSPSTATGCHDRTSCVSMRWTFPPNGCKGEMVGFFNNACGEKVACSWGIVSGGAHVSRGDDSSGTIPPGKSGGELAGVWTCGRLATDGFLYTCSALGDPQECRALP